MSVIAQVSAVLILAGVMAGCAGMTPEERTAIEEQERRRAIECESRGRVYVSGACISRSGGA